MSFLALLAMAWCGSFHQLSTDASYLLTPGRLFVAVRVSAGLLLFGALRVLFSLIYLVLLATVRGGTSFLFPTAKKKQKQRKRLSTANSYVSRACGFELFGTSEKRLAPLSRTLENLPLRTPTSTRFATRGLGQARNTAEP